MERRFGLIGTSCDGVFFTEDSLPSAKSLGRVSVEISRQNANLGEVKRAMAAEAKRRKATAIMNFRYGQKAHPWWDLIFSFKWDTESWHGEGDAIGSPDEGDFVP